MGELEKKAKEYAVKYHNGQFRRDNIQPYVVHPEEVVNLLVNYGYEDDKTKAMGWLHDTVEDTSLGLEEITYVFGGEVAEGVNFLTRNVSDEDYKQRLSHAPLNVQAVKLCDILHNLKGLEALSQQGISKRINDFHTFYVPLARAYHGKIADDLEKSISDFAKRTGYRIEDGRIYFN